MKSQSENEFERERLRSNKQNSVTPERYWVPTFTSATEHKITVTRERLHNIPFLAQSILKKKTWQPNSRTNAINL